MEYNADSDFHELESIDSVHIKYLQCFNTTLSNGKKLNPFVNFLSKP